MLAIPIAGPAVEPVTVPEMRSLLRLDDAAEDSVLAALIPAARRHVEDLCRRRLIEQRWRVTLDAWPRERAVKLPLSPVLRIEAVRLLGPQGAETSLVPTLYRLDPEDPPRLVFDPAVPGPGHGAEGVQIDVVAGYGSSAAEVPPPLVQAVRMLVARWFERRGDERDAAPTPPDLLALVAPYQARRLA